MCSYKTNFKNFLPFFFFLYSFSLGDNLKMGILAGIIFPVLLLLGILRCKKGNSLS